jgi:lipopolysaccharide/colanic/teichoic acid biosynthesis glycosyltransferase
VSNKNKRLLDVVVAGGGLVVLSPVIAVIAVLIALRMGFPVFFRQTRPGYRGEPFEVVKFRTMRNAVDANGKPLSDNERLTPLGRMLRRTSLDEIPQLWNVLRGDMSLVGPRPLLMEYLERYTPEQMRRHDVKPGITGLAQVSGRNNVPWEQKFELDVWYADNWSLWLDLKILARTILKVLRAEGVSAKGMATMSNFTGMRKDDA